MVEEYLARVDLRLGKCHSVGQAFPFVLGDFYLAAEKVQLIYHKPRQICVLMVDCNLVATQTATRWSTPIPACFCTACCARSGLRARSYRTQAHVFRVLSVWCIRLLLRKLSRRQGILSIPGALSGPRSKRPG